MIDIHTHILPLVDDGSKSVEESRFLLTQEIENGIDGVILTPHYSPDMNKDKIIELFHKFNDEVKDLNIKLYLGSEIYYYNGLIKDLKDNNLLTLNDSKYILIEFSTQEMTPISDIVYDININGYIPIIAHIERYSYLDNDDYRQIIKNGGIIQINATSFKSRHHRKKIKYLLKNDLVSFIASDAHGYTRDVDFSYALNKIKKKYKNSYDKIINNNLFDDFK